MSTTSPLVQELSISDEDTKRILDLLEAFEGDVQDPRRRSPREYTRGHTIIVIVDCAPYPAIAHRVRLRNVSRHGIAFLSRTPMTLGTKVTVQLPTGPEARITEKRAVVRRCRHVEGMIHEVGAEFGRTPTAPVDSA